MQCADQPYTSARLESEHSLIVPQRRCPPDTQILDRDSVPVCPATPEVSVRKVTVAPSLGEGTTPPLRKTPRATAGAETLPESSVPAIRDCSIAYDDDGTITQRTSFTIAVPSRVYKHAAGNKSLRGLDIRAIGDKHALCDKPMMIQGLVRVICFGDSRVQVVGKAQLEAGGRAYSVTGWIDTEGFK